jgi:hypothetical protein
MPNLDLKLESIKKEMKVDFEGVVTFSIRATARIVGVHCSTLINAFSGDQVFTHPLCKILAAKGFNVTDFSTKGVPDLALSIIADYYAFEVSPKYQKEDAKLACRVFSAVGVRKWGQEVLGWQPPQQYPSDFQNQVLTHLAELTTKIDNQQAELAIIRPAYEEMQQITPALDKFPELMPLLKEISENIRKNPVQEKAKLKVWLQKLKIAHIVTRGQRQSIGKLVSDFLKIGNMEAPDKKGCNLYYEATLPLIILASQYVLFNQG